MIKHFTPSISKFLSVVLLTSLISLSSYAQDISEDAGVIAEGATLFNANCKSCHKVHAESVGPALANVYDRVPSIDWLKQWIRNSSKVVASGDPYAVQIYEKYKKSQMTAFTSFSDDQIMAILAYVKAETVKGPEVVAAPVAGGAQGGEA
jgi:mono/diheme cytochrome c family protein